TASGDADHYVVRFYRRFSGSCDASHVSLFRRDQGAGGVEHDLATHLLAQDLIYVGGGNVVSMLGAWAAHGLDAILRRAWRRGVRLPRRARPGRRLRDAPARDAYRPRRPHLPPARSSSELRDRAEAHSAPPARVGGRRRGRGYPLALRRSRLAAGMSRAPAVAIEHRLIFAMGGGGFTMEPSNPLLDEFVLELARARATAAGLHEPRVL